MMSYNSYNDIMRAVIDTNVLVEGLSRRGVCGAIVNSWVDGRFTVCVSTALALEYEDVLTRHGGNERVELVRKALQALLSRVEFVPVVFSYRPSSKDSGDDMVIDCAMNGRAAIVTSNIKDFREASERFGFGLYTPEGFLAALEEEK